ncbi:MAG TPA: helix-turn-helix domain-containing protein, partial [Myxococcaceae bacterium]|nr:helix-turn-helix domain-containing protein [Myxococcaceae bacterium]
IPTLDEAERILILRALAATSGHKGKTCQILGISRPTLERKLQKYSLAPRPAEADDNPDVRSDREHS